MITSFVALDLETTGTNPARDHIIEIGMVKIENGKMTGEYNKLVYPGVNLSANITELTGITDDMLEGTPMIKDIIDEVMEFIGDYPLLGHNVIFDFAFLKKAAVNSDYTFEKKAIDTLKLARRLMPEDIKKNLGALCKHFGIDTGNEHRALDDARSALALYFILARVYKQDESLDKLLPLHFKVRKEGPVTPSQIRYLGALLEYHQIEPGYDLNFLTRREASRKIDEVISTYGRLPSTWQV